MSGWNVGGVQLYTGKTRSGKTTAAIADAEQAAQATGFPVVFLDLMRSMSFAHLPHARDAREVCQAAFVARVRPLVWSPESEGERAEFWALLTYWGGCHVVIDEIRKICSASYVESALVRAVTMWGHGKLGPTTYHITAQRPGFLHRDLWPALDRAHIFCLAPGRDAKVVEEELGVPREETTTLQQGERLVVELGFSPGAAPDVQRPGNGNAPAPGGAGDAKEGVPEPDGVDKLPAT
jgi:hypothetical protein